MMCESGVWIEGIAAGNMENDENKIVNMYLKSGMVKFNSQH